MTADMPSEARYDRDEPFEPPPGEQMPFVDREPTEAELRLELASVSAIRKLANARYDELRARLGDTLTAGDHKAANLLDANGEPTGVTVGKITKTNPEPKPVAGSPCHVCGTVWDAPGLVTYVKERWPNQVVEVVKPTHLKWMLSDETLRAVGSGRVVNGQGEIIPDVRFERKRPEVRMAPQTDAMLDALAEAWQSGRLNLGGVVARTVFEIEKGPGDG
jgi:hypothetical protein